MTRLFRSRMFSPGFRLYAGIAAIGLVGAVGFALSTNGRAWWFDSEWPFLHIEDTVTAFLGPVSIGWKGYVGNHAGYTILLSFGLVAAFLAGMIVTFRDADPEAEAEAIHSDTVPLTKAPAGVTYWPAVGALAAIAVAAGWALNTVVLYLGLGLCAVTAIMWTFRNWAYRATGDDEVNRRLYHSFIDPLRVPVAAVLGIVVVVGGLSRALLWAPEKSTSVAIFIATGVALGVLLFIIAYTPKINRNLLAAIVVGLVLAFVAMGIVFAVKGERSTGQEGGMQVQHSGAVGGLVPVGTGTTADGAAV